MILHGVKTQKTKVWKLIFFQSICLPANMSVCLSVNIYTYYSFPMLHWLLVLPLSSTHICQLTVSIQDILLTKYTVAQHYLLHGLPAHYKSSTTWSADGLPLSLASSFNLSKIGGPTSSYATASTAN